MASELDGRKKTILKAVTDDYIISAEPVGSRTIARRYDLGLSPATIRNEMADLEESGFLEQPHASAGRIPSEQGYRYYVDTLISLQQLSDQDIEWIYGELEKNQQQMEMIIHHTSKMLVQMTQYPSLILSPQLESAAFRHVQLVRLSNSTIMVLIVTDTGYVEHKVIEFESEITDSDLDRISMVLNKKLRGVNLKELQSALLSEIRSELEFHQEFYNEAVKLLLRATASSTGGKERVYVDGATKILNQPEFAEVQKFKPLLDILEEEEKLYKLLSNHVQRGAQVKIGHENETFGINDCSIVTASYEIAGKTVGVIGVLGPTRMDYAKVLPIVEHTAAILSEFLTQMCRRSK
ncbi:MAG TPA: heat-inducible transcriptional repressor HrcA [Bacillota bacterium]|jgi:heat-inducible transcriptional repressor|nr:heat-inducible transcriptional repressor HrcA [Bacillota bacterium]HOL08799.1 heat-inducible transcriptional repressor HrcA [Bacillota bacterium]HPO96889.1 heat-inducible transcriptional repressor HrcA [Bacillota bacterium]